MRALAFHHIVSMLQQEYFTATVREQYCLRINVARSVKTIYRAMVAVIAIFSPPTMAAPRAVRAKAAATQLPILNLASHHATTYSDLTSELPQRRNGVTGTSLTLPPYQFRRKLLLPSRGFALGSNLVLHQPRQHMRHELAQVMPEVGKKLQACIRDLGPQPLGVTPRRLEIIEAMKDPGRYRY
nr:hypothetical protein [Mesorhizobium atlanticum]